MVIIEEFTNLWSLDVISDDHKEMENIQKILRTYIVAIKIFICSGLTHLTSFIVIPLLSQGRLLPYQVWLPESDSSLYYYAVFTIENYVTTILLFLVCGIDSLFIALCATIGIQFRLLSHKMRNVKSNMGEQTIKNTLRECIMHQKRLIL